MLIMTGVELQRCGCAAGAATTPDSIRVLTDEELGRMLAKDDGFELNMNRDRKCVW